MVLRKQIKLPLADLTYVLGRGKCFFSSQALMLQQEWACFDCLNLQCTCLDTLCE